MYERHVKNLRFNRKNVFPFLRLYPDIFNPMQEDFVFKPGGESAEPSVRGDHPMTRNKNQKRIFTDRVADRARGAGLSDHRRDFTVASRFAERDLEKLIPHRFFERGAVRRKRKRKFSACTGKLFRKLLFRLACNIVSTFTALSAVEERYRF